MPAKTRSIPKLPLQPGRQQRTPRIPEDEVQQAIKNALKVRGYIILETSEHRQRDCCPKCGEWFVSHKGRGCTPGVPDLLVRHPRWPDFLWIGIEVKGSDTKVSPEQELLAEQKAIAICRGETGRDEALAVAAEFEQLCNLLLKAINTAP